VKIGDLFSLLSVAPTPATMAEDAAVLPAARVPPAGAFSSAANYRFKLTVRKGNILENPRGGSVHELTFQISEGFSVLKAKALSVVRSAPTLANANLISEEIFFKKTKGASQSQFVALNEGNLEDMARGRWNLISRRDCQGWQEQEKTPLQGFTFEIFLYIHRRQREAVPTGLRRATANRVQAAATAIQNFMNETGTNMGAITQHHLAIHQARQPEGQAFTAIPQDNTTRQAQFLDQQRAEMSQASQEEDSDDRHKKKLRIEINGTWVEIFVDIRSLRSALGLPQHNIFDQGIFHSYEHRETQGEDVPDTDHGAPENAEGARGD